jgi:prepilin-type N-terminal cleavage/methylation domain-containing protein
MSVCKSEKGFTIIEILISLFIISAALLIFQSSITSLTLNKSLRFQDIALHIASSEVDTIKTNGYDYIPNTGTFTHSLLSTLPQGQGTITTTDYNDNTKQIVVTVTWQDSITRTVHLTTLISESGL